MQNKLTFFFLLFLFKSLAQAPQSFNYQAIARGEDQKPLADKRLNVDVKILRNGQTVYQEPHQAQTLSNGLFILRVGSIYPGEFQKINWADGDYALKIGVGGAVTIDVPAEPLLSVPYALFADKTDPANLQLKITGNTLSIAGGNSVTLPPGLGGGDNWGDQSVVTGAALTGKGTTASPLNLAAGTTKGQVLKWNGSAWAPAADSVSSTGNGLVYKAGAGIEISAQNEIKNTGDLDATDDLTNQSSAAGDVGGKFGALSVDKLKGQALSSVPPVMGQVLKWDGNVWKPDTDLNTVGNGTAATGAPLLGNGSAGEPIRLIPGTAAGQVLKWNGSAWAPATDETGNSMATTVEVSGTGLSVNATPTGYTLTNTGDTNAADDLTNTSQAGGDLSSIFSNLMINPGTVGSTEIADGSIGSADISDGAIGSADIADGSISSADLAPGISIPISGTAGQDLSGPYPNPKVVGIQGRPVSATAPQEGQVMIFENGQWKPGTLPTVNREIAFFEYRKNTFSGSPGFPAAGFNKVPLNYGKGTNTPNISLNETGNTITLQPGTYLIQEHSMAFQLGRHQVVFRNQTTGAMELLGTNEFSSQTGNYTASSSSFIYGKLTVTVLTSYILDHWVSYTSANTDGLGVEHNNESNAPGTDNIYARVVIEKL